MCLVLTACGEQTYRSDNPQANTLSELQREATSLYRAGRLAAAESKYQKSLEIAVQKRDRLVQARAFWGLGNCRLANYEFAEALDRYSRAEAIARESQDAETTGLIRVAMSDAYQRSGDAARADELIRSALEILPRESSQFAFALISLAVSESGRGAHESADFHFREAVANAELSSNTFLLQNVYNRYGHYLIQQGKLDPAGAVLGKAFLLNKLGRTPYLASTWLNFGRLSLAHGEPARARKEISRAIELGKAGGQIFSEYNAYYWRAIAEADLGLSESAVSDFEIARQQSRAWRRSMGVGDLRTGAADQWLWRIYDGYLASAMRLYERNHDRRWPLRMFELAEESRLFNLQEQLLRSRSLPAEYWRTVARLRTAELALYRDPSDEKRSLCNQIERSLAKWENGRLGSHLQVGADIPLVLGSMNTLAQKRLFGAENFRSENSLVRYKELLSEKELYLSFHVGEKESYLWLLTAKGLELQQLPGRTVLEAKIAAFRAALGGEDDQINQRSEELYEALFGRMRSELATRPDWVLSLDGPLFDVPFAALRYRLPQGGSKFLIERNSLRVVPGISILDPKRRKPGKGPFVGIGDPIYNTADNRWPAKPDAGVTNWFRLNARKKSEPQFARLPGSRREIEKSGQAWMGGVPPVLLSGRDINRARVEQILSSSPAVIHFATHVLQPMAQRELAMIAIGLDARGQPDFLTPNEIAAHLYQPGLVVLTGCSSGQGRALPGVGLFGLTRAWLLSGAQSVVASHWPTPDESGDLFQKFYQAYPNHSQEISSASVAGALRSAQVAMLHSGTWQARPSFWAGFYVMGKD